MLFAFGKSEGMYYVAHGKADFWDEVPSALDKQLKKGHPLQAIAFGSHDTWFYKEAPRAESDGLPVLSSSAAVYYRRVNEIYRSGEVINWVAFGPGGQYVVDTDRNVYSSPNDIVRRYREKDGGNAVPLRCASFGHDGAWVCVEDDGEIRSHGLSAKIKAALNRKPVRNVQLCSRSASRYFIEYVDGETDYLVPSEWHPEIESVCRMDVRIDKPGIPGEQSVEQRIIFAFGGKDGSYCISNGDEARGAGIDKLYPGAIARLRRTGSTLQALSFGEDGAYFLRRADGTSSVPDSMKMAYPKVWNVFQSDEEINWVALGPHGYYIIDTDTRIYASRSSTLLRTYKESDQQVSLRCGSFGYGGAWVVVEDDGVIRSYGLSKEVLKKSWLAMCGSVSLNVQLSMTDPDDCYVEYMDGTSDWSLPRAWHDDVYAIEGGLPKPSTASNVARTEAQRLQLLGSGSETYKFVFYHFITSWRHTDRRLPKVRYIYTISPGSPSSDSAHKSYARRIGNEQKLWHAAKRRCKLGDDGRGLQLCNDGGCSLCQIIRTSYSIKYSKSSGMFGTGIYSCTASSKAAQFSKNVQASRYNAILLNNVVVGATFPTNEARTGTRSPPAGYDSVCGLPGSSLKFDETCVYDDDAIRPIYLVLYDAKA